MRIFLISLFIIAALKVLQGQEQGYPNKLSITQGETLELFISTKVSPFSITIYKDVGYDSLITVYNNIQGGLRTVPDSSYFYGCKWPLSLSFTIPNNWLPGIYKVSFPTSAGKRSFPFIVKSTVPGSYSKIACVLSTNTWEAYNDFGGKSLYTDIPPGTTGSYKVSFLRPFTSVDGSSQFSYELPFIRWAIRNSIKIEYFSDYDLHSNPELLSNFNVLVILGHHEYWSRQTRNNVEHFLGTGRNLIILSGNTCWWQARYEDNGNTLVCYRIRNLDPLNGIADSLVTVNWRDPPVNDPENTFTGLSFYSAGYVNSTSHFPQSDGYGAYTVTNDQSWVFNGTELMNGENFPYLNDITGYENDGALFNFVNGIPVFTGQDSSPTNFRVIGFTPTQQDWHYTSTPHGFAGFYRKQGGGMVFNGGSVYFNKPLDSDLRVGQMLRNIFDKFTANTFPPDIVAWSPFNLVNSVIHRETVPVNQRTFIKKDNSNLNFSLSAVDPYGHNVQYAWQINDMPAGAGNSLAMNNYNSLLKENVITASAFNSTDTANISWHFFNTELALYGDPQNAAEPGTYYFSRIKVFNFFNDQISWKYSGPSFLTLSENGEIKGAIPYNIANYTITVTASNQHGQSDSFSYILEPTNVNNVSTPVNFVLYQNYPNPFNPSTTIQYSVPQKTIVTLRLFDVLGQEITTLVNEEKDSGTYSITFNASDLGLSSGIYFYQMNAGGFSETKRMVFLK